MPRLPARHLGGNPESRRPRRVRRRRQHPHRCQQSDWLHHEAAQEHSSRYASSIARRQSVPIFHVNAEDPDAVVRIGRLAAEYRAEFNSDVVVDLVGYRRHGHSEVDDPTITQPRLYERIKSHPPLWKIYAEHTGIAAESLADSIKKEYEEEQRLAGKLTKIPHLRKLPDYWTPFNFGKYDPKYEVDTGLSPETLAKITDGLVRAPAGFHVHAKIVKLLEQRAEMGHGKRAIDYGFAELLAYGSLVLEGNPVRLTGQDTQRGTFNQRHAVLVDTQTEQEYLPLAHLAPDQSFCEVHNSSLSEAGCVGYEYGFSRDYPEALVLLGSAIRGFRQRRASHHRSIPQRQRRQMGAPQWFGIAASARL